MRFFFLIVLGLLFRADPANNPVFDALINQGIMADGVKVVLPQPTMPDGTNLAMSQTVLREVAGDERSVANFVRDSVTAPFVLKTRDVKAKEATVRIADLWFVVRGHLDELDLKQFISQTGESTVEAGNMRFTTQVLKIQNLEGRPIELLPEQSGRDEWYTRATGRLLDRIRVESIDRVVATRTHDSLTIASNTSRAFDDDAAHPNRWELLNRPGEKARQNSSQTYAGGGSYVKITRLPTDADSLFVEAHFAFVEPDPWFDGNPILRSKLSLICQDQVRQLRREIQKRRTSK